MIRGILLVLVALASLAAAANNDTYDVIPQATPETKAAIAAGRPPEHGYPAIENVEWASTAIKPGSMFEGTVTTSANVSFVQGHYRKWDFTFAQVAPGRFHIAYKAPWLPFMRGHWGIDVVARSVDGVEVRKHYVFSYGY